MKQKTMKKPTVIGLWLWNVEVADWAETLWVTTKTNSLPIAAVKAQKTAKKYALKHGKRFKSIRSITCHGYIDA